MYQYISDENKAQHNSQFETPALRAVLSCLHFPSQIEILHHRDQQNLSDRATLSTIHKLKQSDSWDKRHNKINKKDRNFLQTKFNQQECLCGKIQGKNSNSTMGLD